jgi:hypothetical protein
VEYGLFASKLHETDSTKLITSITEGILQQCLTYIANKKKYLASDQQVS